MWSAPTGSKLYLSADWQLLPEPCLRCGSLGIYVNTSAQGMHSELLAGHKTTPSTQAGFVVPVGQGTCRELPTTRISLR